ncbi:ArsR/SmtB family transcription factor [Arthrobacter sp. AOP36-A1-22]|uniref:ArsR/SmtB family transcription factor n=1 Tax=Arthrobacter sp. AOP36-A1-22 TaxID=3457684 RepID=UPI0040348295
MDVFQVLADPVRRRIVELLGGGERPAGEIAQALHVEFGISQPATLRHLRLLRESGVAVCTNHGAQRRYHLDRATLDDVATWLHDVRSFWHQRLDALDTELFRGRPANAADELNEEDIS